MLGYVAISGATLYPTALGGIHSECLFPGSSLGVEYSGSAGLSRQICIGSARSRCVSSGQPLPPTGQILELELSVLLWKSC
jgi:hypothetical protein